MYTKFWKIGATGSYAPADNQASAFDGTLGTTGITNVTSNTIQQINAIGTASVSLRTGPYNNTNYPPTFTSSDISIASATGSSITFTSTWTGATGYSNFYYFNKTKPLSARDAGITAIMGLTASSAVFSFVDDNNNAVTIPAGAIKQGEIYGFKINTVTTVTAEQILGLGEY
jgi:hypothetical protein